MNVSVSQTLYLFQTFSCNRAGDLSRSWMNTIFCVTIFIFYFRNLTSPFSSFNWLILVTEITYILFFLFRAYNAQWAEAQTVIGDLLEVEIPTEPPKPEKVSCLTFMQGYNIYLFVQSFPCFTDKI